MYGKELILDLHDCDTTMFSRRHLRMFLKDLCRYLDMKPEKLAWWDDFNLPEGERQTDPNLVGTSVVQFILTSNITIHTLDLLGSAYVNVFSCKDFDSTRTTEFIRSYFSAGRCIDTVVERT